MTAKTNTTYWHRRFNSNLSQATPITSTSFAEVALTPEALFQQKEAPPTSPKLMDIDTNVSEAAMVSSTDFDDDEMCNVEDDNLFRDIDTIEDEELLDDLCDDQVDLVALSLGDEWALHPTVRVGMKARIAERASLPNTSQAAVDTATNHRSLMMAANAFEAAMKTPSGQKIITLAKSTFHVRI